MDSIRKVTTHGGSRPVVRKDDGRLVRTVKHKIRLIKIDCSDDELNEIYRRLPQDTRQRALWLLAAGVAPDEPENIWPRGCPGCEHTQLLCSSCLSKLKGD